MIAFRQQILKRKLEARREEKRRNDILAKRRDEQRKATEKFQRANIPASRQGSRRSSPQRANVDEALRIIRGTTSLYTRQNSASGKTSPRAFSTNNYNHEAAKRLFSASDHHRPVSGKEHATNGAKEHAMMMNRSFRNMTTSRNLFETQLEQHQQLLLEDQKKALHQFNEAIMNEIEGDRRVQGFVDIDADIAHSESLSSLDSLDESESKEKQEDAHQEHFSTEAVPPSSLSHAGDGVENKPLFVMSGKPNRAAIVQQQDIKHQPQFKNCGDIESPTSLNSSSSFLSNVLNLEAGSNNVHTHPNTQISQQKYVPQGNVSSQSTTKVGGNVMSQSSSQAGDCVITHVGTSAGCNIMSHSSIQSPLQAQGGNQSSLYTGGNIPSQPPTLTGTTIISQPSTHAGGYITSSSHMGYGARPLSATRSGSNVRPQSSTHPGSQTSAPCLQYASHTVSSGSDTISQGNSMHQGTSSTVHHQTVNAVFQGPVNAIPSSAVQSQKPGQFVLPQDHSSVGGDQCGKVNKLFFEAPVSTTAHYSSILAAHNSPSTSATTYLIGPRQLASKTTHQTRDWITSESPSANRDQQNWQGQDGQFQSEHVLTHLTVHTPSVGDNTAVTPHVLNATTDITSFTTAPSAIGHRDTVPTRTDHSYSTITPQVMPKSFCTNLQTSTVNCKTVANSVMGDVSTFSVASVTKKTTSDYDARSKVSFAGNNVSSVTNDKASVNYGKHGGNISEGTLGLVNGKLTCLMTGDKNTEIHARVVDKPPRPNTVRETDSDNESGIRSILKKPHLNVMKKADSTGNLNVKDSIEVARQHLKQHSLDQIDSLVSSN